MNILFLSISRMNTVNEQGIFTDLLREFKKNNHNVYVACARQKKYGTYTDYLNEDGLNMLRIGTGNITQIGLLEKGISTLSIENQYLNAIKKYFYKVKFDMVIYTTPPITFDKVIKFIKKRDGAKSYLLLKDIFPQNAVDLDMFSKKNPIYWYFRHKEKELYKNSDYIGCMSEGNVKFLLKNNIEIPKENVEVCPNTIEPLDINFNINDKYEIKNKYGIPSNKTVFIYGGNLGKPQGIEFLIECLRANEDNNEAYFLVVGSGTEFNKLKIYFDINKPTNSMLLNHLPKNDYEKLVMSCDVGMIFLDKRFTIPNFPSRILSYMQSSMPVLAATDSTSDIGIVIENGRFGYWCESKDVKKFMKHVNEMCNLTLRKKMGSNARKYLENNYTAKHSYEIIMKHFV